MRRNGSFGSRGQPGPVAIADCRDFRSLSSVFPIRGTPMQAPSEGSIHPNRRKPAPFAGDDGGGRSIRRRAWIADAAVYGMAERKTHLQPCKNPDKRRRSPG